MGRPVKYATEEERMQAKRQQTLESNRRRRQQKKNINFNLTSPSEIVDITPLANVQNLVEGEGIIEDIAKVAKKAGRKIKQTASSAVDLAKKVVSNVTDYGTAVVKGRNDYPPKVRAILDKHGEEVVTGLTIMRTPVPSVLTGALSLFSAGEFGSRMKNAFDTLFHLFLEIRTDKGNRIAVEKNEVINMDVNPKKRPQTETQVVTSNIPVGLTINELMNKTKAYQGGKFFKYSAANNNCQDFLVAIFRSNNIGTDVDIKFIKQETEQLFRDLPYLRKFANTVTDIGAAANTAITGRGMDEEDEEDKDYVVQSVIFDKDHYTVPEAKKWLRENGYKAPNVDRSDGFLRFRQVDPSAVEKEGFTEFRTKELGAAPSRIKLILVYKKIISPSDIEQEEMICEQCGMHMTGGKINVKGAFKKLGKTIEKGIKKEIIQPIQKKVEKEIVDPTKKLVKQSEKGVMQGFVNPADEYVTSKKGGLATDLVKFGIPALSGAVLGGLATAATGGNPVAGVAGSALGSKLGSLASKEVQKATGTGMSKGRFVKGSPEARAHMQRIRDMKKKN